MMQSQNSSKLFLHNFLKYTHCLQNIHLIIFRVIFNAGKDEPQRLIIRPSGIEPNVENGDHEILVETEASYDGISVTPYYKIAPGSYNLYWKDGKVGNVNLPQGGVHTFVIDGESQARPKLLDFLLTKENSVHMLWQIPQLFVCTMAEIMFIITGTELSYTQVLTIFFCARIKNFQELLENFESPLDSRKFSR